LWQSNRQKKLILIKKFIRNWNCWWKCLCFNYFI